MLQSSSDHRYVYGVGSIPPGMDIWTHSQQFIYVTPFTVYFRYAVTILNIKYTQLNVNSQMYETTDIEMEDAK
jgi:hypothetical protein